MKKFFKNLSALPLEEFGLVIFIGKVREKLAVIDEGNKLEAVLFFAFLLLLRPYLLGDLHFKIQFEL
jgi:hypothetical protein